MSDPDKISWVLTKERWRWIHANTVRRSLLLPLLDQQLTMDWGVVRTGIRRWLADQTSSMIELIRWDQLSTTVKLNYSSSLRCTTRTKNCSAERYTVSWVRIFSLLQRVTLLTRKKMGTENIAHLCKRKKSQTWGPDGWKSTWWSLLLFGLSTALNKQVLVIYRGSRLYCRRW